MDDYWAVDRSRTSPVHWIGAGVVGQLDDLV